MKKRIRLLSLLLAAALLLALCPTGALALESGVAVPSVPEIDRTGDGSGGYIAMMENREELGEAGAVFSPAQTFSAPAITDGSLYSQLNTRQKACYNALEAITIDRILTSSVTEYGGEIYRRVLTSVPGMTGSTIGGTVSGGVFYPSAEGLKTESAIYTDLCAALVALRYDHPEIIWTGVMRYGYHVTSTNSTSASVTNVVFDFYLEQGGKEREMRDAMMASARAIAAEAAQEPDTYSKVKHVHDVLAEWNTYGSTGPGLSHVAYSALIAGDAYEPVCDGYAKAFKIVLDLLNIPCITPSSADHMWNNVKMDDGCWYNVDVTWDDSGNTGENYEYFLIGSQTVVEGKPFNQQTDHTEINPYDDYRVNNPTVLKPVTMRFPTKSKTAYVYLGKDYPPLTFPDVKRGVWYYEPIEAAAQAGLFTGDSNGNFLPDKNITRAEVAMVIANALGVTEQLNKNQSPFADVPAGKWYSGAIAWVKENDIMVGSGDKFRPTAPITRQEMCVVIYKLMGDLGYGADRSFPDDAKIASWARAGVYQCKATGIVQGDNKGYFNPLGNTQRSAAAVIFTKYLDLAGELPPEETPEEEPTEEETPEEETPEEEVPEESDEQAPEE